MREIRHCLKCYAPNPHPPGKFESGRILFEGQDLLQASEVEMQNIRGNEISMIFQEPMTSLNPIFTIGDQIMEAIRLHQNKTESQARELALNVLHQVAIPSPENPNRPVSTRIIWWHEATRDDRHGDRLSTSPSYSR